MDDGELKQRRILTLALWLGRHVTRDIVIVWCVKWLRSREIVEGRGLVAGKILCMGGISCSFPLMYYLGIVCQLSPFNHPPLLGDTD